MAVQFAQPYRFSVDDYHRMAAGILTEDARVELIEGEIIAMRPTRKRHASCVDRLNKRLNAVSGDKAIVRVQSSVRLHDLSEAYPDIALLKPRDDFYAESHPMPSGVLLVIEVADSSVAYDREIKMALYARAGIVEAMLINLREDAIEIYSEPVNGKYQSARICRRGDEFALRCAAGARFRVGEFIG
jgi:Uma2 family endonuclease